MDRVEQILQFQKPEGVLETYGLESALCACLQTEEACELLKACAANRVDLRAGILRKVCADIDRSQLQCHNDLISHLMEQLLALDSRARQSLGYCLSELSKHVKPTTRLMIQKFFLASSYISVRRRGYKSIGKSAEIPESDLLLAWDKFKDPECAWIITKSFPVEFLVENRAALSACFSEGWQFSRLYLRIGEKNPNLIDELREINEISYCYVLAKLGKVIPEQEIQEIIARASSAENFGLLVWSLGQMKLWSALKQIESTLSVIQGARNSAMFERAGVQPSVPPDGPAAASRRQGRG